MRRKMARERAKFYAADKSVSFWIYVWHTHRVGGGLDVVHDTVIQVNEPFWVEDSFRNMQVGFSRQKGINDHVFNSFR
jgi:hypothetical protein